MTAPSRGRDDATIRGAVVLVVAIVIGLALLWRSGTGDDEASPTTLAQDSSSSVFEGTDANGSTVPPVSSTDPTETGDTRPPETVSVIVFNGTPDRVAGIAGEFTTKASEAGYNVLDASDAATPTETTTIYAAAGFELDAEALKEVLGLPNAIVAAKPDEPLGSGDEAADIVVVLGGDYAS